MAINRTDTSASYVMQRRNLNCLGDEETINDCDYEWTSSAADPAYAGVICYSGQLKLLQVHVSNKLSAF